MDKSASHRAHHAKYFISLLTVLIRAYQHSLGLVLPNACRFTPTCSEYAIDALSHFGLLKGGLMSILRILRCNPFFSGGYDPVKCVEDIERTYEHAE